jgi:membrane associated rhomboid family serine protease
VIRVMACIAVAGLFTLAGAWIGWAFGSRDYLFVLSHAIDDALIGTCLGLLIAIWLVRPHWRKPANVDRAN